MRLEDLQVELRPRSPWEAVELGMALVRRHARAIWGPWLLLGLPVFVALNLLGWWLDLLPLAAVAMWWLKPVFDRIPLFVLSRAVFGATPGWRETLAAQARWGWRPMRHYLTWRRPGMARALYLPVDLLEGGAHAGARRAVIGGSVRGVAVMLTIACLHFELMLVVAAAMLGLMFVPVEFLSESARALWALMMESPPAWMQVLSNLVAWLAMTLIEPFYVGAGLGLYLNRRTQLEAWDVEIAFRRMRQRLQAAAPAMLALMLAVGLTLAVPEARAMPGEENVTRSENVAADAGPATREASGTTTPATAVRLADLFGETPHGANRFDHAVGRALADPLLNPRERRARWEPRAPDDKRDVDSGFGLLVAGVIAVIAEAGLWIALAILVIVLAWTSPRWWPRVHAAIRPPTPPREAVVEPLAPAGGMPADVPAEARRLWAAGRYRRALALVYRASVHSMAERADVALVPGATEAECLRAARALREPADREAFAEAVRVWQYAAYAERLPAATEFDALLDRLTHRFGWAA